MPADAKALNTSQPTVAPAGAKVSYIPGVQLEMTPGKDVVIRIPGIEQSYRGRIVGYDPYDFIIASVRLPSYVRKKLTFGNQLILKYIHRGTIYGFRTIVHNVISSPASLVFFDYPDVIEKIDLRRASRHKCNIDGKLHTTDGDYECMVVNVSETGCKISARAGARDMLKTTKVDDTMVISMSLGNNNMIKLPIAVRNISLGKGIIYMGSMYLDIRKSEEKLIQEYLDKIQRLTR
ncbi:MAG: flagellar brake protein [Pseudodesulfovibrio sp.]|nr:flagellar brake protein [Pseudodesulfovibrio sp.]